MSDEGKIGIGIPEDLEAFDMEIEELDDRAVPDVKCGCTSCCCGCTTTTCIAWDFS